MDADRPGVSPSVSTHALKPSRYPVFGFSVLFSSLVWPGTWVRARIIPVLFSHELMSAGTPVTNWNRAYAVDQLVGAFGALRKRIRNLHEMGTP
jgi:hypothetical protein